MVEIIPNYYKDFKCIAGECEHSCCIGWEIDIDEETLYKYKAMNGEFGKRLNSAITQTRESAFFTLSEKERCPFLNQDKLCDIILTLGEDYLCQICSDHPRFRSFFDSHTELGLGLCCEAAGELILKHKDKMHFINLSDSSPATFPDTHFFKLRESVFEILQNREFPFECRIEKLISHFRLNLKKEDIKKVSAIYDKLEYMNPDLKGNIGDIDFSSTLNPFTAPQWDIAFEQLTLYFIYRHLADGLYDGLLKERLAFSVLSYYIIRYLTLMVFIKTGKAEIDDLIEISRIYSSEIEYSESNIDSILKGLLR